MTIEIPLTQGQVTIVDDIDADLAEIKWYARFLPKYANGGKFVASRGIYIEGTTRAVYMHRVILSRMLGRELLRNEYVDHIHGNTLDNRRSEIRLSTPSQNNMNKHKQSNNTSGYKGVYLCKRSNKWRVSIWANGKRKAFGHFDNAADAYIAYCKEAANLHGEFAQLE